MSRPLKIQIVEKARSFIENEQHWCRGELARDADGHSVCPTDSRAERRCALGALIAAAYQLTNDHSQAHDIALSAVRPPAAQTLQKPCDAGERGDQRGDYAG